MGLNSPVKSKYKPTTMANEVEETRRDEYRYAMVGRVGCGMWVKRRWVGGGREGGWKWVMVEAIEANAAAVGRGCLSLHPPSSQQ